VVQLIASNQWKAHLAGKSRLIFLPSIFATRVLFTNVCVVGPGRRWAKDLGQKKQDGFRRRLAQKLMKIGDFKPLFRA
jgi:hypothetical protein